LAVIKKSELNAAYNAFVGGHIFISYCRYIRGGI